MLNAFIKPSNHHPETESVDEKKKNIDRFQKKENADNAENGRKRTHNLVHKPLAEELVGLNAAFNPLGFRSGIFFQMPCEGKIQKLIEPPHFHLVDNLDL